MNKINWRNVNAWALYDFASIIFSLNVVSLYFSLWLVKDLKAPDITYSIAVSISMFFVAMTSPFMGTVSDRYKKRIPFLFTFTVSCCITTICIGFTKNISFAIVMFIIANFSYQMAMVFYNALLPEISTPATIGKISGYGMAIGYLGSIVGNLMIMPFVSGKILKFDVSNIIHAGGNTGAFIPTGILFFLFSIPTFLILKDKNSGKSEKFELRWKESWQKVFNSFTNSKKYPGLLRFLIANFFFFDAINTVISFMGVYATKVIGLDSAKNEVQTLLLIATVTAIIGSYIYGILTDKIGSKNALNINLTLWIVSFIGAIFAPNKTTFYIVAMMIGSSLGGTWTTSRPLLSELAPADEQGEFFGLYSLAGKFAAIFGPMIWGLVTYNATPDNLKSISSTLGFGTEHNYESIKYQLAIASLMILLSVGFYLLQKVPDPRTFKKAEVISNPIE